MRSRRPVRQDAPVLVENMLKPLLGGASRRWTRSCNTSTRHTWRPVVGQQVADALAIDQYVKTHTVMVENMIKPLVGEDLSSC